MSYVSRAKELVKLIRRFDAVDATNPQLMTLGQAFLYHPKSNQIWDAILEAESLVINPSNLAVKDDIGTLDAANPPVFTPATTAVKMAQLANLFRRNIRGYVVDVITADELRNTNAPAQPLEAARASVISTARTNAGVIVGLDTDDPEA